jgi:hypothetical protein
VFDGVFAQIAARQTNINMRFSIPGGGGGVRTDHTAFGQAGTRGLSKDYVDDVAQRRGGILSRCEASGTCPKLFIGFSGTEFYVLQGSPLLTDAWGTADLVQPATRASTTTRARTTCWAWPRCRARAPVRSTPPTRIPA